MTKRIAAARAAHGRKESAPANDRGGSKCRSDAAKSSTRLSLWEIDYLLEEHKAEILDRLAPAIDAAVAQIAEPIADALLDLLNALGDEKRRYPDEVIRAQEALLVWRAAR
ncbi:MAG: hypothetical protein N3C63_01775 [Rhodocyclaceae bacterium]|nr:hypothetical protein [Rhodocyclaceae bacterium]